MPLDRSHPVLQGPCCGEEVLPKLPRHTPTAEGATEPCPGPCEGQERLCKHMERICGQKGEPHSWEWVLSHVWELLASVLGCGPPNPTLELMVMLIDKC